jgi:hypothetical protein
MQITFDFWSGEGASLANVSARRLEKDLNIFVRKSRVRKLKDDKKLPGARAIGGVALSFVVAFVGLAYLGGGNRRD